MALAVFILPSRARFTSGQVVVTTGVGALIGEGRLDPAPYLYRHFCGDWGDLDDCDRRGLEPLSMPPSTFATSGPTWSSAARNVPGSTERTAS